MVKRRYEVGLRLEAFDDVRELRSVRDVRNLARCAACGRMGDRRRMLSNLGVSGLHGLHHGRCVVRLLTVETVLALPSDELAKLTLADTGIELMQRLLDAFDRSGVPEP